MLWLAAKPGETATPRRPRSELLQMEPAAMVRAAIGEPALGTPVRVPPCEVTSSRPSGVKARAVGEATLATSESVKPERVLAEADGAQTASRTTAGIQVECFAKVLNSRIERSV